MVEGKTSPIRCRRRAPEALLAVALLVLVLACGDRNTYAPPPPPKVTVSQPLKKASDRLPGIHRQRRGL